MKEALTDKEISEALRTLPGWEYKGGAIRKEYTFGTFLESMAFVSGLVPAFEAADHHPDINISYNRVVFTLSTHSAGGAVTDKDIRAARNIEDSYLN